MIEVKWSGGVGYGDIVSPLSYAHNISFYSGIPIKLIFEWKFPKEYKYNPEDKNCLWEDSDYINSIMRKEGTEVSLEHRFSVDSNLRISNYNEDLMLHDPLHNYWSVSNEYITHRPSGRKKIVVNTTLRNIEPFSLYNDRKAKWKDTQRNWSDVISWIENYTDYECVLIDYRVPVEKCIEELQDASLFIGYHGATAWLARMCKTPSIIVSIKDSYLSHYSFRYAIRTDKLRVSDIANIESLIYKASTLIDIFDDDMRERKYDPELYKQLVWGRKMIRNGS